MLLLRVMEPIVLGANRPGRRDSKKKMYRSPPSSLQRVKRCGTPAIQQALGMRFGKCCVNGHISCSFSSIATQARFRRKSLAAVTSDITIRSQEPQPAATSLSTAVVGV